MSSAPARTLADALADSPLAPLMLRMALLRRLADTLSPAVAQIAPDFDAIGMNAVELKEDVLVLNARSAAQAAKLRQGTPGFLRLLRQHGFQVIEIRVKVQPARMSYPERTRPPVTQATGNDADTASVRPVPRRADAGVTDFADQLSDRLPDSPLRDAARRLQAALRRPQR